MPTYTDETTCPSGKVAIMTTSVFNDVFDNFIAYVKRTVTYGLGHETVAVLLPGFAINW